MDYDVCIIGAGVAGALAAWKIVCAGKSVVMLDAGPRFDFLSDERYERAMRGEEAWDWLQPGRDQYEESATPGIWLNNNRVKGVGGTTLRWNARAERLKPADFNIHSRFGISVDWPITYDAIKPWYFEAEQQLGVAGKESPGAPPRSNPFPLPHHPISYAEKKFVMPAFRQAGLPIGCDSLAINSQDHDDRPRCDMHSSCMTMCPNHAKYTAMAHVMKAESTGNVTVKPDCHVRRIKLNSKRKVQSVAYKDKEGITKEQRANTFILAAGGVEIPRLLLLSADDNYPNGLTNSSGQVGKNYMTHPWIRVQGDLPEKVAPHRGGFSTACSWALYNHDSFPERGNAMLKSTVNEGPEPAAIALNSDLRGKELMKKIRCDYGNQIGIDVIGEMLPQQENKIGLSHTTVDCYGDPVPKIDMHLSDFDKDALLHGADKAKNVFKYMKASNIKDGGFDAITNHIIGTTRMGKNPAHSVCDEWGRCHELDNLYIAGSSLFPTSGCSAPTLTISALSLRTADYISRNL